MEEHHVEERLFYYTLKPDDIQSNIAEPLSEPSKFIESFVKHHGKERKDQVESILRYKEFVMDTRKQKKSKGPKSLKRLRQKKVFTNTDKRQLKLYEIPEDLHSYELYEPLHELWLGYVRDSINTDKLDMSNQGLQAGLLKLDLHGCLIKVTKSKCPSYIGCEGIVLQETKNSFKIITRNNQLKTLLKASSEFTFVVDDLVFTIFGKHFCLKSAERSVKGKFKTKVTIDL